MEIYGEKLVRALPSGYHYHATYGGYGTSRIGEWCLNHIHSMNHAEVINASLLNSSAGINYGNMVHVRNTLDMHISIHIYMYMHSVRPSLALVQPK